MASIERRGFDAHRLCVGATLHIRRVDVEDREDAMREFAGARRNMIENQLRPSRIDEPALLAAMAAVPREAFLPKRLQAVAYRDEDVDIGNGRHLIEPLALAKMLQAAQPRADEVALVVGCETGYCAAVLARLVATVFHLTGDESSVGQVEALMEEIGCDNVVVQNGDPRCGLEAQAPFGLIMVAGGVAAIPDPLAAQLETEGRLVCIVTTGRAGKVTVRRRIRDAHGDTTPFDAWVPRLASFDPEPTFKL